MLGDSVLVAPLATKGIRGRTVLVPPGLWGGRGAALPDHAMVQGPAKVQVGHQGATEEALPLQQLLWFQRIEAEDK